MSTNSATDTIAVIDRAIRVAFIHLEGLDRRVLSGMEPPLTTAQYHALHVLCSDPGITLGRLAERLLCDKANASGIVTRLEALGWVTRDPDETDRRRVMLRATGDGAHLLERARAARQAALAAALEPDDLSDQEAIAGAITRLSQLLENAYRSL